MNPDEHKQIRRERWKLLVRIERILNGPMIFLGFVWLALLVIELTEGLSPALEHVSIAIWIIFIIDFLITFTLAPQKIPFLKKNVLTIISLIVPALRIFRLLRFIRILRSVRLVKVLGSLNRSMKSLAAAMSRRAFGYMVILTIIVILAGAAGMFALENEANGGMSSFGEALWFTAMIVITVGTEHWPQTTEGRILCFILALYGFAVLGYITATLATFFIGRDADETQGTHVSENIAEVQNELAEIKEMIRRISKQ